jgi:hypothetical protein
MTILRSRRLDDESGQALLALGPIGLAVLICFGMTAIDALLMWFGLL